MAKVRRRIWTTKTGEHTAWVADYFSPGPDGKRQRHTKTFATRKEATAWLAHTQGIHTPAHASPTVLEAGEQWIAQAVTDGLERATVRQYRQHLDLHIKPSLGHHKLAGWRGSGWRLAGWRRSGWHQTGWRRTVEPLECAHWKNRSAPTPPFSLILISAF
jgi:hypothetical protein